MVKCYYLVYGAAGIGVDDLDVKLGALLSVTFTRRESSYIGEYSLYEGPKADRLSIEPNLYPFGDWSEPEFQQYPTLVYLSNTEGKNVDKAARTEAEKVMLAQQAELTLLKETVLESSK